MERLYLLQGHLVDYYYATDCSCCDDEKITEESWGIVRPTVGKIIEEDFFGRSLNGLIDSQTLLKILLDSEYDDYSEFKQ